VRTAYLPLAQALQLEVDGVAAALPAGGRPVPGRPRGEAYAAICLARAEPNSWPEARSGLSPDDSWMTARFCVSTWGLVAQVELASLFEGSPVRAEGFAVRKLFEPGQRIDPRPCRGGNRGR